VTSGETDEQLMVRYQAGDASALEELYRRHAAALMRFVTWLSRGGLASEDLLQDVFLQVHRARRTYQPSRAARPWIFGIARHVVMDHLRKKGRSLKTRTHDDELQGGAGFEGRVVARAELEKGLAALTESQRQAFVLIRVVGLSTREAALAMETREVTAKVRLHRAMSKLRSILGEKDRSRLLLDGAETHES